MYHSVTFDDKNTWEDWHLIPSPIPIFNPPPFRSKEIEIPGADGVLDLAELLTGRPSFGNRSGSFEFLVVNGYWTWDVTYSTIMSYLHGRRRRAILEDDPTFYYEGRFTVNSWKSQKVNSSIVIDYSVYPFKREMISSVEDWKWDDLNFETGQIKEYSEIDISGTKTITLLGSDELVCPTFEVDSGMTMEFNGKTYSLVTGKNKFPKVLLKDPENEFIFTGTGKLSVDYRGGWL